MVCLIYYISKSSIVTFPLVIRKFNKEASELENKKHIEDCANKHVLDLINLGVIKPSQVKEKTKEVIEFYSTF